MIRYSTAATGSRGSGSAAASPFKDAAPSLVAYVTRYAKPEPRARFEKLGKAARVGFLDYDRSLNSQ